MEERAEFGEYVLPEVLPINRLIMPVVTVPFAKVHDGRTSTGALGAPVVTQRINAHEQRGTQPNCYIFVHSPPQIPFIIVPSPFPEKQCRQKPQDQGGGAT